MSPNHRSTLFIQPARSLWRRESGSRRPSSHFR